MLLPLMIVAAASNAEVTRILSPNGLTYVDVELKDGHLMYSAGYRQVAKSETTDVCLLESSPLGFVSNVGDFTHFRTNNGAHTGIAIGHHIFY